MKKILFVLAIGAFAASCTDATTDSETTTDTTVLAPEAPAAAVIDSAAAVIDSATAVIDSVIAK